MRHFKNIISLLALSCALTTCQAKEGVSPCNPQNNYRAADMPDLPDVFVIAGDSVDLTSYENRERLDRELISFTFSHTNTLLSIKRANRYFPAIERILRQNGIPDDMKYLAVVESSLNPRAVSYAGAAGTWQFMERTAKEFGLEVSDEVDERYDVERSTAAACQYLLKAYARFHSWLAVAASYNAGQGRVNGFQNKQLSNDATHWWMTEQTSRYIFRLIAAKMLMENPPAYGYHVRQSQLYPPIAYEKMIIDTAIPDLAAFAKNQGLTYYQFKDANLWLRGKALKNEKRRRYMIRIPKQSSMRYDPMATKAHDIRWCIDAKH